MSSSSSEESSGVLRLHIASSRLSSTTTLVFSQPSDSSDFQTEITPPTSPVSSSEGKLPASKDNIEVSRGLGKVYELVSQVPIKAAKQRYRRPSSQANNEAGYEADGDERGTASAEPTALDSDRRPKLPRVDTKQRKRVTSLLASYPRGTTSTGCDPEVFPELRGDPIAAEKPSHRHEPPPSSNARTINDHEFARRAPKGALVGLGLGLPSNHPLRVRAFTMPVVSPTSPAESRHGELLPSQPSPPPSLTSETRLLRLAKLTLGPTKPEVCPSPIEFLPPSVVCYPSPGFASFDFSVGPEDASMLAGAAAQKALPPRSLLSSLKSSKDPGKMPPVLMLVPSLAAPHLGENGATADEMLSENFSACISRVPGLFY
ncbi:hypothetical protein PAXRUDRAFT_396818 [Paxillus rubicundulus Ve08.2h10]|uniref:Uncharacterized protein n=1 Tax=Paxillus rubicundulus Ve08.2h10 TaxID=930991 RepID=A0A0D0DDB7_9AGAM|nr:hypothetical protein PAXRUDRAFT_396818 [Paxillus rubicundulus Ve08.2h10]